MTEPKSNSERFLAAFASIENEMEKRVRSDRYISYAEMTRRMAKMDRNYARYQRYLEEFGDLRNAIVHERIDGEVIAEPHTKLVLEIEQIATLLTQPIKAKEFFLRKVLFVYEDQTLADAIGLMMTGHYSKLPTYDRNHRFVGMLTTDAITYFLAQHIGEVKQCIPDVSVSSVVKSDDKAREVAFMNINTSLLTIVSEFERTFSLGKKLQAVILTQDGAKDQKPLGIVTLADLPTIYEKINKHLL